ncbi:hypothetical protein [Clostridium butyricum]|uniref:Uncharacterized protein n=1 Tax=Clostridium butyricum E4 str. BoNT E BL5262 TaxID=632245 RepID=C4IEV8_CLOBU|nr:hypothetical protein [Clostridium butyricum]EDT74306.1 hypothetical protein CBY_2961 [Clostridium butyricum 5521]EEP55492.1 hypothetical protein CLP_3934 [Clostridium butyricum E4 str. BoNT E BL5262]NFL29684.1 hypothetical protein [Clostridium butyricum]NFS16811.1 hypothetical protein [Clostridium butyricum]
MELLSFISNLSSFATIQSWINDQYKEEKAIKNINKLNNIDLEIRKKILETFNEESEAEYMDNFIAEHAFTIKDKGLSVFFSEKEKKEAIDEICKTNYTISKDKVTKVLNEYFYLLNNYLNNNISFETKFIKKCLDQQTDKIIDVIKSSKPKENIFNDKKYSSIIISKCNAMNTLMINSKFNTDLLLKPFAADYLTANDFESVLLKLDNLLRNFHIKFLNDNAKKSSNESLEALYNFVSVQTLGSMINLTNLYNNKIKYIITCIRHYEYKDKEFYMSLGALGLFNNDMDKSIYVCVMENLIIFFDEAFKELKKSWGNINYKKNEDNTIKEMNRSLYYKVKWYFTKDTKKILKKIYENNKILDTELAEYSGSDVMSIRKLLYSCTQVFLRYNYADDKSTYVFIDHDYKEVIKEYYNDLFEEE